MNRAFVWLINIVALFGFSVSDAYAANKPLPERLAGVWVGGGKIYKSPGAPLERVRCRFSAKWSGKSKNIDLRYICLGIDIKFETTGTLKYDAAAHSLAGKMITVGIGAFRTTGKDNGNNVVMNLTGKDKETGKAVSGVLSIRIRGKNALRTTLTTTDPKSGKRFQAFSANFKR